jgi:glycosyl transferase family 87
MHRFIRFWLFPFLAAHTIFPVMWVVNVFHYPPVTGDWHLLKTVADHFMAGDWSRLYTVGAGALDPRFPWRYPPFALYVVAPLAWLPDVWAYSALAGVEVLAVAAALRLLQRLEPFRDMRAEWVLAIVLSAPMLTTIVAGQSSGLIMLCIAGAASLWARGEVTRAGAVLGLLAIKPNWGIVFGVMAVVQRKWNGAWAMAGVAALLCALTLPLGFQLWADFLGNSVGPSFRLEGQDPWDQITLRAFLEGTMGRGDLTLVLWTVAATALVIAAVLAWRTPGPPLRHLGIGVLLGVSVNPYAFFYDALVLAIPATVWWAERDRWNRTPWLIVGALLALMWCWEQWLYSWDWLATAAGIPWWRPRVSIVGFVTPIWLVLAAREARRRTPVAALADVARG